MSNPVAPSDSPSTDFAVALLGEFVARGVRDVVLCPGSRSQALALAAAAYEKAGLIRLRVRVDERVAGFLALGIAVETHVPVLIVTTSGTAVANLHPAVLEAHHSGVPLILLTADRPSELRGIGSNQTTEQVGIFSSAVGWLRDVQAPDHTGFDLSLPGQLAHESYSAAAGHSSQPGPVQLNLAFREPLSGPVKSLPAIPPTAVTPAARQGDSIGLSPHTIVIAGHAAGDAAETVARQLGVPLIAEISSGSHFGPNLVVAYRELLADPQFGGRVERAIVFGHPTISREIPALLQRSDVEVIVVRSDAAEAYNPGHRATIVTGPLAVHGEADASREGHEWLGTWVQASRAILEPPARKHADTASDSSLAREQLAAFRAPVTRRSLVELVWRITWPHDRLVLGASRIIRVADSVVPGKKISVHSNRGLAGIDGTIATAIGIALASQDSQDGAAGAGSGAAGVTRVLLGDLTLLHDAGSLLFGSGEVRPRIQVIVGNDGGGTIFDNLEVAATADSESFDRVQYTPQSVDLASLAAAYGWEYRIAATAGELDAALAASDAPVLVEVPLAR